MDVGTTRRETGQAAIMSVLVLMAVAMVLTLALAELGASARDRSRAQSSADAAALAGLDGGFAAAQRVASANGSTLVSWSSGPGDHEVTVVVLVGGQSATARASDRP